MLFAVHALDSSNAPAIREKVHHEHVAHLKTQGDYGVTMVMGGPLVSDDGKGFDQQIFDRLGDPYVTTRPGYTEAAVADGTHEGMGLGLFIAKTLLERSGATVTLTNQKPPAQGARVAMAWTRSVVDIGPTPAQPS